jgi:hypothetical protein
MECPRCKGLMVEERFEDIRQGTGPLCFDGWRCVICGEIRDPVIETNREAHQAQSVPVLA